MSLGAVPWLGRWVTLLVLAGWVGGGCSPGTFLVADEDRERNLQRAREAERLGEYEAAAEFYEKAIEKNPESAAVHLGYASLCEGSLRRYADAVYHYQRYLKFRVGDPKDPKAEVIRRRITNCVEQLVTTVPLVVRSETIARDLAMVRGENAALRGDNLQLRSQLTNLVGGIQHWSNEWSKANLALQQALAASSAGGGSATYPGSSGSPKTGALADRDRTNRIRPATGGTTNRMSTGVRSTTGYRTHTVQRGETLERIARRYGTTSWAIQRANPQIRARSMHVGTVLRIPER